MIMDHKMRNMLVEYSNKKIVTKSLSRETINNTSNHHQHKIKQAD